MGSFDSGPDALWERDMDWGIVASAYVDVSHSTASGCACLPTFSHERSCGEDRVRASRGGGPPSHITLPPCSLHVPSSPTVSQPLPEHVFWPPQL